MAHAKSVKTGTGRTKARAFVTALLSMLSLAIAWHTPGRAEDVILDGDRAIAWLIEKDYITPGLIPKHNFLVFRSQMTSGGSGPHGLRGIIAGGWKLTGPLDTPLQGRIVIIVDDASLNSNTLLGQTVTPKCHELSYSASCTATVFNIGSRFTCAWDKKGCTDSVFTITNIIGNKVELYRADQSCPASPGLTANYAGVLTGRQLAGSRKIVDPGKGYLDPGAGHVGPFTCDF
jgi:hypothetical protein